MGVFALYDRDTDAKVYFVTPSPESTNVPSTIYSETESSASAITIQSEEQPGYFVLHHGRQQPASENIAKWFPLDNIRRYILRHIVTNSVLGGDYVGPVKEVLEQVDDRERRVLELGTRTGTWTQAMATQFPHAQFLSLDVVPMIGHTPRDNVTFEVYDFTEGLMLADESQDIVFLNGVLEMTKNYRSLLREVHRVLRPGGLIHVRDFNPHFWDPENISTPAWRTNPQGCRAWGIIRQHISNIGIDPDTCDKLPLWLVPGSDLWDNGQKGFKDIESVIRTYPAYPHEEFLSVDRIEARIVPYIRHLCVQSWQDAVGVLKDTGMDGEEAQRLTDDVLRELTQPKQSGLIKLYCVYATKL